MEILGMSQKEISRLEVMQKLDEKRLSQKEAGRILDLGVRQIKRVLKAYRQNGAAGLISKRRGSPGNNRLPAEVKKQALDLLKSKYQGFGPTLAHEKLTETENVKVSVESVRQWMIMERLWKPRKVKRAVAHPLRERRVCFGELVQIDGSPHDWFEGRAPECVLLVFIDDATGKIVQLRFVENESFFSYCAATVSKNLTVQFETVVDQLQTERPSYALRNARVTICVNAQQQVTILYKGNPLPYEIYHQQAKQAQVVMAKGVKAALKVRPCAKPAPDHPWRNYGASLSRANVPAPRGGDISTLPNR